MKQLEDFFARCLSLATVRAEHYGHPSVNLQRIADIWSVYLQKKISSQDVAVLMCCLKIARLAEGWHQDSIDDAATYLGLADLVVACSKEDRLRVKSSKDLERVLNRLKVMTLEKDSNEWLGEGWVRKNKLLKRCDTWLEDVNHLNRILFALKDQGQIEYEEGIQGKTPTKIRLTQAELRAWLGSRSGHNS